MVCDQEGFELIEKVLAQPGVAKQALNAGLVDLAVGEVLDHGQDQRPMRGSVDHGAAVSVGENVELVIWPSDRQPYRRKPVEVADVPLQRIGRAFVPRHVEADSERLGHGSRGRGRPSRSDLPSRRRSHPEQLPDPRIDPPLGSAEQGRLGRRTRQPMFHRHRQRRLSRDHADRREQRGRRQDVEQKEQCDGELEPPPAASRWIVKNLSSSHEFRLFPRHRQRQ